MTEATNLLKETDEYLTGMVDKVRRLRTHRQALAENTDPAVLQMFYEWMKEADEHLENAVHEFGAESYAEDELVS